MQLFKSFKNNEEKRSEYNKIALLAGRKLNSIEEAISKALTHAEISHKDLSLINKTEKYCRLNESVKIMESQRSDVENDELIEDSIKMGIY